MNHAGTLAVLILLAVLVIPSAGLDPADTGDGANCIASGSAGNSAGARTGCPGQEDGVPAPSPIGQDRQRVRFVNATALRGMPFAVERPSAGLLAHAIRVWRFDDTCSVSAQSAADLFGQAPADNGTAGRILTAAETNAITGTEATLVLEYPPAGDGPAIVYNADTGAVTDRGTGSHLFIAGDTSQPPEEKLSRFLEAARTAPAGNTYTVYRIRVFDPVIEVDPVQNITAGSTLRVQGSTNLPPGTGLEGQLRPSLLYSGFRGPETGCFITGEIAGMNRFSCMFSTGSFPYSEFLVRVRPVDRDIHATGYSRLFTIFPEVRDLTRAPGFTFVSGTSSDLRSCESGRDICTAKETVRLDRFSRYDRVLLGYDPADLNITAVSFARVETDPWKPAERAEGAGGSVTRLNNKTLIITPNGEPGFTGPADDSPHPGQEYEMDVEFTYPNPAAGPETTVRFWTFSVNYLWRDGPAEPAGQPGPGTESQPAAGSGIEGPGIPKTPAGPVKGDAGISSGQPAPKASLPVPAVLAAIIVAGAGCSRVAGGANGRRMAGSRPGVPVINRRSFIPRATTAGTESFSRER